MKDLALVEQQLAVGVGRARQAADNTVGNRQPRQQHSDPQEVCLGHGVQAAAIVGTCFPSLEEDIGVEEAGHRQQDGGEGLLGVLVGRVLVGKVPWGHQASGGRQDTKDPLSFPQ